jgi:hypothetical protein
VRQTEWISSEPPNGCDARPIAESRQASRTNIVQNFSMATPAGTPADRGLTEVSRRLRHVLQATRSRLVRVLALTSLVMLCGCSALKSGYEQGEHLAYWWLDRYVDLEDSQTALAREGIANFFRWHRREQLPVIASLLEQAKDQVQHPVIATGVRQYQREAQRLGHLAFQQSWSDVAILLAALKPEQIGAMEKRMAEENAKYRRTYLRGDDDARLDARMKRVMRYAELIYGNFSAEQQQRIRAMLAPLVQTTPARLAQRERRQQAWLTLVREVVAERPPKEEIVRRLERFAATWRDQVRAADTDVGIAVAVQIANLTTPAQKQHAVTRLQGWLDDTRALMRRQ